MLGSHISISAAKRILVEGVSTAASRAEARKLAVDALLALGIGDGVMSCDYADVGGRIVPSDSLVTQERYDTVTEGLGEYIAATGLWYRRHVARRLRYGPRVETWRTTSKMFPAGQAEVFDHVVHGRAGIADYVRVYASDAGHVCSFIGVVRDKGSPFIDAAAQRQLGLIEPLLVRLLRVAWRHRRLGASDPADLVCDNDGTVLHATPAAVRWLDADGARERIVRAVDSYQRGEPYTVSVAGRALLVRHLVGDGPTRWLVHLPSAPFPTLRPADALTNRQREVAELAAAGLTTREVARELGMAPETAKSHLKVVYAELGVSSRVELAQCMDV